jgi:hypothetical protein
MDITISASFTAKQTLKTMKGSETYEDDDM